MRQTKQKPLRIIPLGGLGEVGKNMTAIEYGNDIVLVDAGVKFPEDDAPGIDLIIPDISYLVENRERVRGILITHGHLDHVGALPYVLKELRVPVYATKLTLGLVKANLAEHQLGYEPSLQEVAAGQARELGRLRIEFFHLSHSIPDCVGMAIHTPVGTVVYATDFKFDQTPIDGRVSDFHKLTELGERGVLALLSDSTNAERPGYTPSESEVGETFLDTFQDVEGRIFVATFASNVHRLQQAFDAAKAYNRKVAVAGRSMENVVRISAELGYLHIPDGMLVGLEEIDRLPANRVVVLTTGSQGEPMAALSRMANGEHRRIEIVQGDTVIVSATPIPGNERTVGNVIDQLFKLGANVMYERFSGIHVSGHPSREELKLLLNLVKPKFFMPIHGEYRMLRKHATLAGQVGIPGDHAFILDIGDVLELLPDRAALADRVSAGKVFVDGLGVGDVGNIVIRDRRVMAQDGILIVVVGIDKQTGKLLAGPDIISRGFVYMREAEALLDEARLRVRSALQQGKGNDGPVDEWSPIKGTVRDALGKFFYERTKRRPMILPIVMEVPRSGVDSLRSSSNGRNGSAGQAKAPGNAHGIGNGNGRNGSNGGPRNQGGRKRRKAPTVNK